MLTPPPPPSVWEILDPPLLGPVYTNRIFSFRFLFMFNSSNMQKVYDFFTSLTTVYRYMCDTFLCRKEMGAVPIYGLFTLNVCLCVNVNFNIVLMMTQTLTPILWMFVCVTIHSIQNLMQTLTLTQTLTLSVNRALYWKENPNRKQYEHLSHTTHFIRKESRNLKQKSDGQNVSINAELTPQ